GIARDSMAGRWVAAAMLVVAFVIVGIFLWAVIRPPAPPSEAPAGTLIVGEKRIAGPGGPWTLAAQGVPRADRTVAVSVWARDLEGRLLPSTGSPTARLRMLDMAMDERVDLVQETPGAWRGLGRVSMAGSWSLVVEFNGESLSLPFRAIGF
ncbi:MAG: hypothetical protein ACREU1_12275, partial [Burkholderiales bacterium]